MPRKLPEVPTILKSQTWHRQGPGPDALSLWGNPYHEDQGTKARRIHETMTYECLDEEHAIAKLAVNDTWRWISHNVAASRSTNAWKAEFVNNLCRWSWQASTPEIKERL